MSVVSNRIALSDENVEAPSEAEGQTPERKHALIVLGMHRSGTSAITRVLSLAGARLPSDLMGAGVGNETGHWESSVLADFHDRLLEEYASGWDDWSGLDVTRLPASRRAELKAEIGEIVAAQFRDDTLIVVKDPRICRFAPLFLDALTERGYEPRNILALRSPIEVIESLAKRNQMARGQAALLWLRYTLDSEYATRHRLRVIVDYADLLGDWRAALALVQERLGAAFRYAADEIADQVDQFLSADRRHHVATLEQILFDPALREWVGEAYSALLVLKRNPASSAALATLDRVRKEFNAATPLLQRLLHEADEARAAQARHFERELFEAREQSAMASRAVEALERRAKQLAAEVEASAVREGDARLRTEALETAHAEALEAGRAESLAQREEAAALIAASEARLANVEAEARAREADALARIARADARSAEAQARFVRLEGEKEAACLQLAAAEARVQDHEIELRRASADLAVVRRAFNAQSMALVAARENHERELACHETAAADAELALTGNLRTVEDKLLDTEAAVTAYERRMAQLQAEASTLGARVGRLLTRWRTRLAPSGSWQTRALGKLVKLGERVYRLGPRATAHTYLATARPTADESGGASEGGTETSPTIVAAAPADYAAWIDAYEPTAKDLAAQRADRDLARDGPLISIVLPIYKVPADVMAGTLRSLMRQTYPKWEACIAYADLENEANWAVLEDFAQRDGRFRPRRLTENLGISGNSNAALKDAKGEFIALLDHDDELTDWALYDMAREIVADDQADFLYSDKDTVDETGAVRINPLFKPEWSPEMLYSVNYLTHLNVMRRSIIEEIGGWRAETDGAQDWDLFLRVTEKARKIRRVCGVHYHWRVLPTSVASGIEAKPYATAAQLRTVKDRVERLGLAAYVMADQESGFRLSWRAPRAPDVDLIIDGASAEALANIWAHGSHDFAAWVASVSIVSTEARDWRGCFGDAPVRHFAIKISDDRTAAMLEAAASGTGAVLAFFDADIEKASAGWIDELAGWVLGHPEIAFAGSLLLTQNNEVLEAGRVLGASGTSAPLFNSTPLYHWGPLGGPLWFRNISAVSPHAVACRRALWPAIAPGEAHLEWREAFVMRCEKMLSGGRGLVSPYVRLVRERRDADSRFYWDDTFRDDPYFHPGFESVAPLRMRGDSA